MSKSFDVAVIGSGVFGSWTAYQLQRAGAGVVLIDAYGPGNSRSSSGGETRIIRMGYGQDEIYTRWSKQSLSAWKDLAERCGRDLFHQTGVLWMARENDPYTIATLNTLGKVGVEFQQLRAGELAHRYPQIHFGDVNWAILEPGSGVLLARRAIQSLVSELKDNGVEYLEEAVSPPAGRRRVVTLNTQKGTSISADTFIFACGPWLPKLFADLLGGRIHPTRQEVFFFGTVPGDSRFKSPGMPAWIDFGAEVYGMPDLENRGFKMAIDRHGPTIDPDSEERLTSNELLLEVRKFLARRFPAMKDAPVLESRVCQYENTSDGNFLIDRHPAYSNVWIVGGGSGHGFKHGPALGDYVKSLVLEGVDPDDRFSFKTKGLVRQRAVY